SSDNILSLILFLALNLSNLPEEPLNVLSEWFLAISYAFINRILSDSTPPFDSITRIHSISIVPIILNVRSLLTFFFRTFSATHLSISAFCEMKFAIDLFAINFLNLKANFLVTRACDAFGNCTQYTIIFIFSSTVKFLFQKLVFLMSEKVASFRKKISKLVKNKNLVANFRSDNSLRFYCSIFCLFFSHLFFTPHTLLIVFSILYDVFLIFIFFFHLNKSFIRKR
ncbi:hypothetical protein CDIK_3831, partial [Cucumispora dikerogammari]